MYQVKEWIDRVELLADKFTSTFFSGPTAKTDNRSADSHLRNSLHQFYEQNIQTAIYGIPYTSSIDNSYRRPFTEFLKPVLKTTHTDGHLQNSLHQFYKQHIETKLKTN